MNLKNKNFIYFILAAVLIISVSVLYLFSQSVVKKERQNAVVINNEVNSLKIIQKNIDENIGKIKKIDIPVLRYGYFYNKNSGYFISEILNDSRTYHVKLNYLRLKHSEKHKNMESYSFRISGYGNLSNVYLFIRTLEYKDKIQLSNFLIKSGTKSNNVLFYSDLSVHTIKKSYILTHILKYKHNLNPSPRALGIINPFRMPIMVKQPVKLAEHVKPVKPAQPVKSVKQYPLKTSRNKLKSKFKIKKTNESIVQESRLKKSDAYNKKGVSFFVQKKYEMALDMFKRAIEQNPSNYRALSNAALDNYEKKDYNNALFYAKRALELRNAWQINFILGLIYLRDNDFVRARHYFSKSIRLNPSNYKIKYYLGIAEKGR